MVSFASLKCAVIWVRCCIVTIFFFFKFLNGKNMMIGGCLVPNPYIHNTYNTFSVQFCVGYRVANIYF